MRTLSLRNLLARSSRERRTMKMRRRKLRKRRAKLPAPHAPVWDTATCSVPTVPHLAPNPDPQPLTAPIGSPSSPGSAPPPSPGNGGESCCSSSWAHHAGNPTVLPVPMGASTRTGWVRWPRPSTSPLWLSPARAVHSSVTLIPINPPGGPVQAPCRAGGEQTVQGDVK